jgi:Flp pilus assembly protein TadD
VHSPRGALFDHVVAESALMRARAGRVLVATVACLVWLNGCETSTKIGDLFQKPGTTQALPSTEDDPAATGTVPQPDAVPKGLLGTDPNDDLSLGKKHFRAANFGTAEKYFRRAVEQHPRDLEAWVGLAASYDRLRRWDMADRAYEQAMKISGPTAELLNNKGYSYMLRGDYPHAHQTLRQAQALDPNNPYIKNNLELLEVSYRKGKAVR